MSALDKFYDFTLNLPDAKLTSKAMSLCNIDRNVFNIYLTLQEGKNNPILNADLGNYTVTMIVVKPKTKEYVEKVGVVDGSNDRLLFELGETFNDQIGSYKGEIKVQNGDEVITSSSFAYTVTQSLISGLNAEIEANPDVEILRQLINEVKAVVGMTPGDPDSLLTDYQKKNDNTLITTDKTIIGAINENSSQIKEIENNVDEQFNTIETKKLDKNGIVTMANMGQDVKEALVDGGKNVAVVGINSVLKENIVNGQVTAEKTNFLKKKEGINLFNKAYVEDNCFYDINYHKVENSNYATTGFIEVDENTNYSPNINQNLFVHYFDVNKNKIKSESATIILTPANCKYMRCTIQKAFKTVDTYMVVKSNSIYTGDYIAYQEPDAIALDNLKIHKSNMTDFNVNLEDTTFIKKSTGINLFNKAYVEDNCFYDDNGNKISNSNFATTHLIEVNENETICKNNNRDSYINLYDENKIFIKTINDKKITIPAKCKYVKFTIEKTFNSIDTFMVVQGDFYVDDYCEYEENYKINDIKIGADNIIGNKSKLSGLKWEHIGDSISSIDFTNPTWFQIIQNKTNCSINSYGISGTTLAHKDDRHLWDYGFKKLDANEIGYNPSDSSTWGTGNCFCERYTKLSDDADIITVMGGTNDDNVALGEWESTDTSTFYGALNVLIRGLLAKFPDKTIAFFTPIQTATCYSTNYASPSKELDNRLPSSALRIELRAEAIKRKCAQYGIPCLDLFHESGISGAGGRNTQLYLDGVHPTLLGQKFLATRIENFIESLI